MDPVSAVGFASAILTFVDFSIKIVRGSVEIYTSTGGVADENARLEAVIAEYKDVTEAITQPPPSTDQTGSSAIQSKHSAELQTIATRCRAVATHLSALLKTLERKDGNKTWRSVHAAWKTLLKKEKVTELERSLSEYRSQIIVRLSLILHENGAQLHHRIVMLDQGNRHMFRESYEQLNNVKKTVDAMDSAVKQLSTTSGIETSLSETRVTLEAIARQLRDAPKIDTPQIKILNRLYFESYYSRLDSIEDADFGTFQWLVDQRSIQSQSTLVWGSEAARNREAARSLLVQWMRCGNGVLHICGKAGSGKSTLMSLLWHSSAVKSMLQSWAGADKLVTASCFFWNAGSALQKNLEGLYRSLLFEILRQCPELAFVAFPEISQQPAASSAISHAWDQAAFRPRELQSALKDGNLLRKILSQNDAPELDLHVSG